METKPFEGPLWESIARGHLVRAGHALVAHLERISDDQGGYELYRIVRECCEEKK